jgi:hypothetical protein
VLEAPVTADSIVILGFLAGLMVSLFGTVMSKRSGLEAFQVWGAIGLAIFGVAAAFAGWRPLS